MQRFLKTTILLLTLSLIQCSNDDNSESNSLLVNGAAFKIGENTDVVVNEGALNFTLGEKSEDGGRLLQVFAMYSGDNATGTYTLRSNLIEPGVANVALYDQDGQIAGGSDNQPTGTLTITHYGGEKYKLTFNDVTLDPGTSSETTISGSCMKTFPRAILID